MADGEQRRLLADDDDKDRHHAQAAEQHQHWAKRPRHTEEKNHDAQRSHQWRGIGPAPVQRDDALQVDERAQEAGDHQGAVGHGEGGRQRRQAPAQAHQPGPHRRKRRE